MTALPFSMLKGFKNSKVRSLPTCFLYPVFLMTKIIIIIKILSFLSLILQKEQLEVSHDRESIQERARMIRAKYMGGRTMSGRDRRLLAQLEGEETTLVRRERHLQAANLSWLNKCLKCCRPFEVVFGIFYLLFGLLIIVSLFLTWYVPDVKI